MFELRNTALFITNGDKYSVWRTIEYEWCTVELRPLHTRLWRLFFRQLFDYFGICNKYLISCFWNISHKEIERAEIVVCQEWAADYDFCRYIRCCFPKKRLIIWIWNLRIENDYLYFKNLGWEVWSFDQSECKRYGLNYNKSFMAAASVPICKSAINCAPTADVFFFGRDKGRKDKLLKIKELLDSLNISNEIKIFDSDARVATYNEILEEMLHAKTILDVPLDGQEGITQREMEALFFGKKLITTNPAVKNRDYYNESNIFIIYLEKPKECHSREGGKQRSAVANPPKITDFLQKPYVEIDREIIESYSIEAWLQRFRNNESAKNYSEFQRKNFFEALKRVIIRNSIFLKNGISSAKIKIPKNKTDFGRIAVYMVNTGGYDTVLDPLVVSENCDYFLFTDNPDIETKIWQKILVDKSPFASDLICSRYYKMLPHKFLDKKYDYSIYLDAKNLIVGDIARLVKFVGIAGKIPCRSTGRNDGCGDTRNATTFAAIRHNARKNIVEEKQQCIQRGVISAEIAKKQVADYLSQGFPDSFGLIDCRCLIRKHSDKQLQQVMEMWFAEFEKYPYRDQLSIMFSLWKSGFDGLKIIDGDVYNNQFIKQNRKE